MYFFGHLGIGSKIVSPLSKGLSYRAVLAGTILPDLMDKSLYYALSLATGKRGAELGLISGGRTFGHTALFAVALAGIAFARKSRIAAALALGVASHLLLDQISDVFIGTDASGLQALLWPFRGWNFPVMPYQNLEAQLAAGVQPFVLVTEVLGLFILGWDYWKGLHRRDLLKEAHASKKRSKYWK